MTVAELIAELSKLDQNAIIYIADSEWGTDEFIGPIKTEKIMRWDDKGNQVARQAVVFG